ncbi:hypothetical protein [Mycolicibacterium fluoranthenivorans]|uniref:Molecular chaperone DnaJ n=1 Tax=Mycolicibacterium fluoranthenivorans TaxID=258505 RepID=A0A1G4X2T6_9MYCO|nr:hypothetical protein [Mycolicibacterium fluoranthenivorans]SCX34506.1 hypothetical protein SAMN02799620_06358 [Mycolicibacterium fluoranthenivorans]
MGNAYPPGMTLRPLDGWPFDFTRPRREAPFRSTFTSTLSQLDTELRLLDPDDRLYPPSVLQVALTERDFRKDGMPRADSRVAHPGVILNVEPRNRPALSFPCDTFTHWHDNLRAITLGLESLRKLDRYGITQTGQQYRGWQAIEAKPAFVTAQAALDFLGTVAAPGHEPWEQVHARGLYRDARARTHPDRGGARETWDRVEAAGAVLRAAGWLS